MKHVLTALLGLASATALAAPKKLAPPPESKAVIAARGWVAAMIDPKATAPAVSADKPVVHDTNSVLKGCDTRGGTVTTSEANAKVHACYVVSYADLKLKPSVKPTVEEKPYKDKTIGEDRLLSTLKGIPTTSTLVSLTWEKGQKSVEVTVLVDPDDRIRVAWMAWQDHGAGD